jgi:hypothetical protein
MEKEFVPYGLALELKQLGFNERCYGCFSHFDNRELWTSRVYTNGVSENIAAPLFQQAFRFFREKYSLVVAPQYFTGGFYCFTINNMKDTLNSNRLFTEFETYEEAELACLKKLIEIVKTKEL